MRLVLVTLLSGAVACGGPPRDAALAHATTVLEHGAELEPDARVLAWLAITYERGGRVDDAERIAQRAHDESLPEPLRARLATLELRLAAARRGEPRADDPRLTDEVIRAADHVERQLEELRRGTAHEPPR
jgi:hypothetical protein